MNTRICYRYADKRDCRQYTSVVVSGTITWEQIDPYLAAKRSFVPGQVGLEDLQYRFKLPGVDHSWHQITPADIRPTEDAPTIMLAGEELARRFADIAWDSGWFVGGLPRHMVVREPAPLVTATTHSYSRDKAPSAPAASSRSRKAGTPEA